LIQLLPGWIHRANVNGVTKWFLLGLKWTSECEPQWSGLFDHRPEFVSAPEGGAGSTEENRPHSYHGLDSHPNEATIRRFKEMPKMMTILTMKQTSPLDSM
jgi:hypothetical protein